VNRILVVTHCAPQGLPQQGSLIAEGLRQNGVQVRVIGRAKSGWGRLIEIVSYSLLLIPRYDVVLIDVFGLRAFVYESVAILYGRLWRKRSVVVLRNGSMRQFIERWPRWTPFILSQPDLVFTPHQFLQEQLAAVGLRVDGTIPNFVKLEKYNFRERGVIAPRFLYLRGMHPMYNAPMALRAFALIQRKYPDAELTMAGKEGQDSDHCRSLVRSLKLRNVHFLGLIPKDEIPVLADKHDIYLHTNRVDNMPVSIIEMWACGIPIVGTNVGGIPYLIRNREDGLLVESEDYETMAEVCFELLSNPELVKTLSFNGRVRAMELGWEKVKPKWEQALLLDKDSISVPASMLDRKPDSLTEPRV
jgi:L-malate glycosyltransferase